MPKITLGQAKAGLATHILFFCGAQTASGITCARNGNMPIGAAIARWGEMRALDAIPARCERCGSADVDVTPYYPAPMGSPPLA
jgi:hypothetical protein